MTSELYDKALLKSVSRSFCLSMNALPSAMRAGISIAYLLARATDTVADTVHSSPMSRLDLLEKMDMIIKLQALDETMISTYLELSNLAPLQTHQGEAQLMRQFSSCIDGLMHLEPAQQNLIRKVLDTIIKGQKWDLTFFQEKNQRVSPEILETYAYQVAGCVGEFWTELGFLTLGDKFSEAPEAEMKLLGVSYGKGLQLINILRDQKEDAERGRIYIADHQEEWLSKANEYIGQGEKYSSLLKNKSLRFASILPALIGQATLNLISKATPKAKISRSQVKKLMFKALFFSLFGKIGTKK